MLRTPKAVERRGIDVADAIVERFLNRAGDVGVGDGSQISRHCRATKPELRDLQAAPADGTHRQRAAGHRFYLARWRITLSNTSRYWSMCRCSYTGCVGNATVRSPR